VLYSPPLDWFKLAVSMLDAAVRLLMLALELSEFDELSKLTPKQMPMLVDVIFVFSEFFTTSARNFIKYLRFSELAFGSLCRTSLNASTLLFGVLLKKNEII
jgi:hypothetical protein